MFGFRYWRTDFISIFPFYYYFVSSPACDHFNDRYPYGGLVDRAAAFLVDQFYNAFCFKSSRGFDVYVGHIFTVHVACACDPWLHLRDYIRIRHCRRLVSDVL